MNQYYAMEYEELKRRHDKLLENYNSSFMTFGSASGLSMITPAQMEDMEELAKMEKALKVIKSTTE